ncbi:MAG TPA: adenylate/guanylate cyclase domain-containing protein [Pelomicrobium sp.]|nr:adenylate/guanylate cyclase domain-containing protein [Pelomicrobium sp.]
MASALQKIIGDNARHHAAGVSEEERLKRDLLIFTSALMCLGVVVWLGIYWLMGLQFSTDVALIYQFISVGSLVYYLVSGNFAVFRFVQLTLYLFFPFWMQWSIGNFVDSSGVMLWALLAPIGAAVFHGWRESVPWFVAFLVLTFASGFFDYFLLHGKFSGIPLETIAVFFALNFAAISAVVYLLLRYFIAENARIKARLDEEHRLLEEEQEKSEKLLLNVLPAPIADRLKSNEITIADGHADVTVMFADIVDFTRLTQEMNPDVMVQLLNKIFSNFDFLVEKYSLDKIKTVGDAYMSAGGLSGEDPNFTHAMADMSLEMLELVAEHPALKPYRLGIHVGMATGPVVAGVIGTKRFIYDLWGDTVNTASRLTSDAFPGRVQVDRNTYLRLRDDFAFEDPTEIMVKGKGAMTVYRLVGRRSRRERVAAG